MCESHDVTESKGAAQTVSVLPHPPRLLSLRPIIHVGQSRDKLLCAAAVCTVSSQAGGRHAEDHSTMFINMQLPLLRNTLLLTREQVGI